MGTIVGAIGMGQALQFAGIEADNAHPQARRPDGRGNVVREMDPRLAAPQAVITGNAINYHGGPVLHTVNLYYILYGNWAQTTLNRTGTTLLTNWAQNIGGTPYFNINTSYGDTTGNVPNAVTYKGAYTDAGSLGTSLSDSNIAALVVNGINSGALGTRGVADPNGLYLVLTAPGVTETSGFLTKYCGWHSWGTLGQTALQFGFVGNAAGPRLSTCASQSTASPNNDPGVDGMISVIAHELSETVSDPQGNGWYDATGAENGDKCAWNFGTTYRAVNGALANVNIGGKDYLIQQMWLNALGGKCALSYAATPDFGISISGSQSVQTGQTSGNYTLTANAVNGFSGSIVWSVSGLPTGITATPTSSMQGNSATFTLTAASSLASGTYTVPVTGTSGSTAHTVSATLVVTAPSFNLTINPASKTVRRPTSGSTTTTYAVNVAAVGALNRPVTLAASGGTTGITVSMTGTNPVSPGSNATLSVTITNSAKTGPRTLIVTGSAAGIASKQASAQIIIQ